MDDRSDGTGPRARAFRNILKLEQEHGYEDRAVSGGLDRFLALWQQEARQAPGGEPLLHNLEANKLFAVPYGDLPPTRRKVWVRMALECVDAHKEGAAAPAGLKPPRRDRRPPLPPVSPERPASVLRGVTARVAPGLRRLGVSTVGDLIYLVPRRHNEIRKVAELQLNEEQTVQATVWNAQEVRLGRAVRGTEAAVGDETGNIRVVWFNQPYLAKSLKPQTRYVFSGRVTMHRGRRVLESPQYEQLRPGDGLEELVQPGRLFPVYPLTGDIRQGTLRRIVREALERGGAGVAEALPEAVRQRNSLLHVDQALRHAHYPKGWEGWEAARRRLAFEELFTMQLAVLSRRLALESMVRAVSLRAKPGVIETFLASLPFHLTEAQRRTLGEVLEDMAAGSRPMSRLLQGEVGSGKTVVALAALLVAATGGYQAAIMAPTEVLAEQHFLTVGRLLEGLARPLKEEYLLSVYLDPFSRPVTIGLLLGSMTAARKRKLHGLLADGTLDIAIGTHALIQEEVSISRLALAVVDEQHRFGVLQRSALRQRGDSPHLLVMSATPIPRTLALTLYGDLDISTIDELPPGRRTIRTRWVRPERRDSVYQFLRGQVVEGRQAFVIYPLIDESEAVNARAAVKERDRLAREVFPELSVGLLHGRMPLKEKQEVMDQFRQGRLDILVSTPVVEVGIDVPNATVMLVEGADRFGLAQLHQFRGRVGRGEHASYCILVAESPSEEAQQRLAAMERLSDGFQLAEVDLELRGPGEFFGTRQSGLPDLRVARLSDQELLALARTEAQVLLTDDPELAAPEHRLLAEAMARFSTPAAAEVS